MKRILILRTSALGDVVHCLPVLTSLRRHFPTARLGWVVEGAMAPVLEGHPDLDELIPIRLRPWRRAPLAHRSVREVGAFLAQLAAFRADVAVDLMGNHKAGVLAGLSWSDNRIGLARSFRREPSSALWISHSVEPRGRHAVERALSVLTALGIPAEPPDFGGDKLFRGLPSWPERGFVLIHPGAGWGNKIYPPERWAKVAQAIASEGFEVRVVLAPGEEQLGRTILGQGHPKVGSLEAPDLPSLARALRASRLVLAGDTGPMHLAHALGTAVVAVMGPTDPETHGPFGCPGNTVSIKLPCSFCHQRFDGPRACMLAIEPEQIVATALARLLG